MFKTRRSMLSSLAGLALCAGFAAPAAAAGTATPAYTVPEPAAILVVLPGFAPPQWVMTPGPAFFPSDDVAATMPAAMARLIADEEADLARLTAAAENLAAMSDRALETALTEAPPLGPGQASGIVTTAITTDQGSCSETVTYSYPGNGAAPLVKVRKAGNACPPGAPFASGTEPSMIPTVRSQPPRLLEAAAPFGVPARGHPTRSEIAWGPRQSRAGLGDRLIPTGPVPQAMPVSYPTAR
jgi:hypothetical protein